MRRSIAELIRRLKSNPGDEAALYAVFRTVRDSGLVGELAAVLDLWQEAERGESVPDDALAGLYVRIAKRSTEARALELCRSALDLCPSHAEALSLFEELADERQADELCARYQDFLRHAPSHAAAPRVRAAMIEKLVAAHYHAARANSNPWPSDGGLSDASAHFEQAFATALMRNALLESNEMAQPSDADENHSQVLPLADAG